MLKMYFLSQNVIKHNIFGGYYTLLEMFIKKSELSCDAYIMSTAGNFKQQMHRSVFFHCPSKLIWVILSYICEAFWVNTEGCWFSVQQSSSSSGTRVSLLGLKRQTPSHINSSSALTIYLQLGQGRGSGLFPNLPKRVWLNACLRKPAVL